MIALQGSGCGGPAPAFAALQGEQTQQHRQTGAHHPRFSVNGYGPTGPGVGTWLGTLFINPVLFCDNFILAKELQP